MLPPLDARPDPSARPLQGLSILGSTGSIGTQTLEVARLFPDRLRVRALAAGSNADALAAQALEFGPDVVALADTSRIEALKAALAGTPTRVVGGAAGLAEVATLDAADTVVAAVVGVAGLKPTLAAVQAGKRVALANKEALVVAGAVVEREAAASGAHVVPVDSEHSALFQCLVGERLEAVESLILTASGGPFRTASASDLERVTPEQALDHPNWDMGAKVTIDSATLMNKGLEVIEARWLFGLGADRIQVLVHPQSIVHSLVVFRDGSAKAQLGVPDMCVPIQYALTYPARWPAPHPRVDWMALSSLDFEPPDLARFPALGLAFDALKTGGDAPARLNAANEVAVARFLQGRLGFTEIPRLVERALEHADPAADTLDALLDADAAARAHAQEHPTRVAI